MRHTFTVMRDALNRAAERIDGLMQDGRTRDGRITELLRSNNELLQRARDAETARNLYKEIAERRTEEVLRLTQLLTASQEMEAT